jgi:hypothetical protein
MNLDSWSCLDSSHRTVVNLFYLWQEYRRAGGSGDALRNDVVAIAHGAWRHRRV